jgi:hypothetical protein
VHSADAYAPDLRALFQVLPGDRTRLLRLELVKQRLGIVIIDQLKRITRRQPRERGENELVPLTWSNLTHIQLGERAGRLPIHK